MLKGKNLLHYINLFSNAYEKNNKVILKYFSVSVVSIYVWKKISQEFGLKNIEIKNYFIKEIDENGLMSKKHRKLCISLTYIECSLILVSAIAGYVSISVIASITANTFWIIIISIIIIIISIITIPLSLL